MDIENLESLDIELPSEFDGLPVFLVGGATRDCIRGLEPKDYDLMVAEVTPSEMESRGFLEIDNANNDTFAVFQDSLGREVAIAREEESTGDAHDEFAVEPVPASVEAGEAVSRDLKRRDFSVNAMAFDVRWETLHDPHGGVQDLEDGVLRAVDESAFRQDPLRILRGARFSARLDAEIEPATKSLMTNMVSELDSLPQERVRMELEKCLVQADEPSRFFRILDDIGALKTTFPELHELKGVPAGPPEYHQEGDSFDHTMMVLDEMKKLRPNDELALLMSISHDMGKAATEQSQWPNHPRHQMTGVPILRDMAERLGMSNEQENAMVEACRLHMRFHDVEDLRSSTVVDMWQEMRNFHRLVSLAVADSRGREPAGEFNRELSTDRFDAARRACDEWTGQRLIEEGHDPDDMGGEQFGNLLHQKRVERMRELER